MPKIYSEGFVDNLMTAKDSKYVDFFKIGLVRNMVEHILLFVKWSEEDDPISYRTRIRAELTIGENKWISVKDRLPESVDEVLLFSEHGITIGFHSNNKFYDYNETKYNDVLYWMSLPDPPQ